MRNCGALPLLKRFGANADGVTAIEFAIIAPVLMLFVVGIMEVGLMVGGQQILEDAVFVGSRTTKTGYVATGSTQAATVTSAIKKAAGPYLDPTKLVVTSTSYPDYSSIPEPFTDTNNNGVRDPTEAYTDINGNGKYDAGAAGTSGYGGGGEVVVFTATYPWKLYTPLIRNLMAASGTFTLSARAVIKNEPYDP